MKTISRRSRRLSALISGLIAIGALPLALRAQDVTCVRVAESPRIDGRLDDKAWQGAPVIDGFRMVEPRPGEDPSERTEARVIFDGHSLYIGVYCHDSEPDRISANSMAHDSGSGGGGMRGLRLRAPRVLDVERRHRPGPPRSVPGQAQCLRLFRQSPRGPRRRPGLCRRLEPQLGRDLGGRKRPPRRRLVGRVPHPLQDDLLQARAQRLGPQHRADDRPQDGDDPAVRHDPRQQLQQPQRSGHDAGHRGRQAGHGHHLPALRPVQRRQRQPAIEPVRHRGRRRVRPL